MRPAGFLLLVAGWGLVLSAIALLASPGLRAGFALTGFGVEMLGLTLVIRTHVAPRTEDRE